MHQIGQQEDRSAQLRMPSTRLVIKLNISTVYARATDNDYQNGVRQPNPPRVNMLKLVNHIEANRGKFMEGKHLKFPIASHHKGP